MEDTKLCDCGHPESPHEEFTRGYGTDREGKTSCYACCGEADRAAMRKDGKIDLYLTVKENGGLVWGRHRRTHAVGRRYATADASLSNWPGSLKFRLFSLRRGEHCCWGGRQDRFDVDFIFEGYIWHGVQRGDNNQVCRCKRTKTEWRLKDPIHPERGYGAYTPRKSRAKKEKAA